MDLKLVASSRKEVIGGVHYTLLIPYNEPATYTSDRRSEPVEADFSAPSDPFRRFDWAPTDPWPEESISDRVGKQNEHSKAVGLSQKPEPPAFCRISDYPSKATERSLHSQFQPSVPICPFRSRPRSGILRCTTPDEPPPPPRPYSRAGALRLLRRVNCRCVKLLRRPELRR